MWSSSYYYHPPRHTYDSRYTMSYTTGNTKPTCHSCGGLGIIYIHGWGGTPTDVKVCPVCWGKGTVRSGFYD